MFLNRNQVINALRVAVPELEWRPHNVHQVVCESYFNDYSGDYIPLMSGSFVTLLRTGRFDAEYLRIVISDAIRLAKYLDVRE